MGRGEGRLSHLVDARLAGRLKADHHAHVFVLNGVVRHLREKRDLGAEQHLAEEALVRAPELRHGCLPFLGLGSHRLEDHVQVLHVHRRPKTNARQPNHRRHDPPTMTH